MTQEDMKALERRVSYGVRGIKISPLLEAGKIYDIKTYEENAEGTLTPAVTHCCLTWQSKWLDEETQNYYWSNQAYFFATTEKAQEGKEYLEKHLTE